MISRVFYDRDIAYDHYIRKVPRIQIENRGYEIIKDCGDDIFIIRHEEEIFEPYLIKKI